MSKQRREFQARAAVDNFSKVLACCGVIMLVAIFLASPFDLAPEPFKWLVFLANCLFVFFAGVAYYGFFRVKRKKDWGDWIFYSLMVLLALAAFIAGLLAYIN